MRYVIIGNSAAGNAAAEAIRWNDSDGKITILSDELHHSYYRPLLPLIIENNVCDAGRSSPRSSSGLILTSGTSTLQRIYRDRACVASDLEVQNGVRVSAILPDEHQLLLEDGEKLAYDKLLLATGASAYRPPIPGSEGSNVFVLRTLNDAIEVRAAALKERTAVIVGGGRIGTKAALALRHLGVDVTIVEMMPWMIPQQLDAESAAIVQNKLREFNIEVLCGRKVKGIQRRNGEIFSVVLDDTTKIAADFVILATGVAPNAGLAKEAGIAVRKGVLVNQHLQTSRPDIYAAGDVVETVDILTGEPMVSGTWTNAVAMGHAAGENMAGEKREYSGGFSLLNALDIAGVPVISAGQINCRRPDMETHVSASDGVYRKLVFRDGKLVGMILLGDVRKAGLYTTLIGAQTDVSGIREALLSNHFNYADVLLRQIQ